MNTPQINKLTSYGTLKLVLDDPVNKPVWSALPGFVTGVNGLYGSINVLAALAQAQGVAIAGITIDKARLTQSLISRTIIVAGAAFAYASASDDTGLAAKFDITASQMQSTRDSLIDDLAQRIHDDAAAAYQNDTAGAANYGLTDAMLTDLQTAITAYTPSVGSTRAAQAKRKSATDAIPDEFHRADNILNNVLDRLVPQFEADHKDFVAAYWNARQIVQAGGGVQGKKPQPNTQPQK